MEMKFLLLADEKKALKNDKRRKSGDFLCKHRKKAAKPTFGEGGNLYENIYPTKWYRGENAGGAIGLSSHRKVRFFFASSREDEQEKCPIKLGQTHRPPPLDLITSGRKEHGTVCCLPLTHTHSLPCFLCYSANFWYFSASEWKKGCKLKAQSSCIVHTSNFQAVSDIIPTSIFAQMISRNRHPTKKA